MLDLNKTVSELRSRHLTTESIARDGLPFSKVIIFGAGHRGNCMRSYFEDLGCDVLAFIDNNASKQGGEQGGLPILSLEAGQEQHPDVSIFIASHYWKQISLQILRTGFNDFYMMPNLSFYFCPDIQIRFGDEVNRMYQLMTDDGAKAIFASVVRAREAGDDGYLRLSSHPQYEHPEVRVESGDIVIDGGAFNGDTALQFHEAGAGKVISFEPFKDTCSQLVEETQRFGDASVCINKALWFKEETLRFITGAGSAAGNSVGDHGTVEVQATAIDIVVNELGLDKVDLIKLDVEGSEMEALLGAKETIKRHRPKIQMSLYHKLEDLWELTLYLADTYPGYSFYIGHHSLDPHETVLYAINR